MASHRTRAHQLTEKHRWFAVVKRIPEERATIGAEIGVLNGATSANVLQYRPKTVLIMVDPWSADNRDQSYIDSGAEDASADQAWLDENMQFALDDTMPFEARRKVWRMKSEDAAPEVNNGTLDYVFIDGDHSYEGVKRDITLWWPKVKEGGWIGGHDWKSERHPEVTYAVVDAFVEPHETDTDKTWFVWK